MTASYFWLVFSLERTLCESLNMQSRYFLELSVEWFDQESPCNLHNRAALGEVGGSHSKNTKCGGSKVEPVSTSVAAEVCVHSGCQRWGKTAPSVTPGAHWKWMGNAAASDWVCEPSLRPCNLFEMHTLHVNRQLSFMWQRRRVRHRLPQKSHLRNALNHHVAHVKAEIRPVINSFATTYNKKQTLLLRGREGTCPLLITSGWEGQEICFSSVTSVVWCNTGKNEFEYTSIIHC